MKQFTEKRFTEKRLDDLSENIGLCIRGYKKTEDIFGEIVEAVEILRRIRNDVQYSEDAGGTLQYFYEVFGIE
jgi:hypothetical protein